MEGMRILIYSNPLVVDKISKKFLVERDSGFIFTKHLINSLPSLSRVTWLVPEKVRDPSWFKRGYIFPPELEIVNYPYSTSIHQNRYNFHGNELTSLFPYTRDVDVIITNQPEVATNLRVWAYNQRRDLPLIYSFFHWIDCEASRKFAKELGGYFFRQYDGALTSDAVYLHPEVGTDLFKEEILRRGLSFENINFREFAPPLSFFGNVPMKLPYNKKIILFNHRANNTTGWKQVLEAGKILSTVRDDFVIWFTDETIRMKAKGIDDCPFVVVKEAPEQSYGYLMANSHFAVCNHKGYSTWNMAVLDTTANGCLTLLPRDKVYRNMFNGYGAYHDYYNLVDRMDQLLDYDDYDLRAQNERIAGWLNKNLPPLTPAWDITNDILERLANRKLPAKFNDVLTLIEKEGRITKKEFVNRFWSFHVNSNFQLIRWNLLNREDIMDDVTEKESTYEVIL